MRKTFVLLILFPVFLFLMSFLLVLLFATKNTQLPLKAQEAFALTQEVFTFLLPIILIWGLIVFFFQKQIMFSFSGAKAITRKEYPEIYNIVENLCISRGLVTPKI